MSPARRSISSSQAREDVARWLRTIREERGLSQEALAQQLAVSQPYVSRTETGDRSVRIDEAMRWAIACGLRWEEVESDLRALWLSIGGDQPTLWDQV